MICRLSGTTRAPCPGHGMAWHQADTVSDQQPIRHIGKQKSKDTHAQIAFPGHLDADAEWMIAVNLVADSASTAKECSWRDPLSWCPRWFIINNTRIVFANLLLDIWVPTTKALESLSEQWSLPLLKPSSVHALPASAYKNLPKQSRVDMTDDRRQPSSRSRGPVRKGNSGS